MKEIARSSPPGHKCPGYAENEKPAEAGSDRGRRDLSLLQEAFWLKRSLGIYARASEAAAESKVRNPLVKIDLALR
jgi:hypothetical protein